jgi:hypothetical protein
MSNRTAFLIIPVVVCISRLGIKTKILVQERRQKYTGALGRVNKRENIIFLDFKKAHMFQCKIYMYRI